MERKDKMICSWCESNQAIETKDSAHWELPDGTRAVTIENVPAIQCPACSMTYLDERIIEKIEDLLMIIDTSKLKNQFTYEELMNAPKLLKRNYFNF